ncbi:MAG: hypothetical protein QM754_17725 [Tepidisphaeraceae bacterium]
MDFDKLWSDMLAAMKGVLQKQWKNAKGFAESEAKKMAQTLISIETSYAKDLITKEEAEHLLDMQKGAAAAVLTALKAIGIITAMQAIEACAQSRRRRGE